VQYTFTNKQIQDKWKRWQYNNNNHIQYNFIYDDYAFYMHDHAKVRGRSFILEYFYSARKHIKGLYCQFPQK